MFRCHFCQRITPPKTTRHSVVIETREKTYEARQPRSRRRGFNQPSEPSDRGGSGVEIMKEVSACPECASKHQAQGSV